MYAVRSRPTWSRPSRAPSAARPGLAALTPDRALVARFAADLDALADAGPIALAVSGGPDSMALLMLAAAARSGAVHAISVDHGLRPEARSEVERVAALCRELGVPHHAERLELTDGPNLQARAREARYAAIAAAAKRAALAVVATAHHADDQAETVLMRLSRGAGVSGLAGIRPTQGIAGMTVVRPLLRWRKAELSAICRAAGVASAEDPSNRDPRFDRTAMRAALRGLEIDPLMIAKSASHLAGEEAALDWAAKTQAHRLFIAADHAVIEIDDLPEAIVRRLLLHAFAALDAQPPRGPDLERAMAALAGGRAASLSGVLVRPLTPTSWRLAPEPPRRA